MHKAIYVGCQTIMQLPVLSDTKILSNSTLDSSFLSPFPIFVYNNKLQMLTYIRTTSLKALFADQVPDMKYGFKIPTHQKQKGINKKKQNHLPH